MYAPNETIFYDSLSSFKEQNLHFSLNVLTRDVYVKDATDKNRQYIEDLTKIVKMKYPDAEEFSHRVQVLSNGDDFSIQSFLILKLLITNIESFAVLLDQIQSFIIKCRKIKNVTVSLGKNEFK